MCHYDLLPPANDVSGKVMFLRLSVCSQGSGGLTTGGGGPHPGGLHLRGSASGSLHPRESAYRGRGSASLGSASGRGGSAPRRVVQTPPQELEKRAVRIPLECFLVIKCCHDNDSLFIEEINESLQKCYLMWRYSATMRCGVGLSLLEINKRLLFKLK